MPTLAELEARHDRGTPSQRSDLRSKARRLAAALEVECPTWAVIAKPVRVAAPPKKPRGRHRGTVPPPFIAGKGRRRTAIPGAAVDRSPLGVPAELRAWVMRTLGAVVQLRRDGVTLHELSGVRRFASVAEAVAAVTAP